jgi:hypothetical protein
MPRALLDRRPPRHHLVLHRRPAGRGHARPVRTSDLVLALLGVALLGGFALRAACALTLGSSGG